MKTSEQINELAAALSKAQSEIKGAIKDSKNPFFKSEYASLESVIEALKDPFSKHGLCFCQPTKEDEMGTVLETIIMHSSGQWISGELRMKPIKDDPQAKKSAISYAKRTSLAGMVGIPEIDDDGEGAMGRNDDGKSYVKQRENVSRTQDTSSKVHQRPRTPSEQAHVRNDSSGTTTHRDPDPRSMENGDNSPIENLKKLIKDEPIPNIWKKHPVRSHEMGKLLLEKMKTEKLPAELLVFVDYGVKLGILNEAIK